MGYLSIVAFTHTQNERVGLNNLWRPFQLSFRGQGHLSLSEQHWSPDLDRCNLILRLVPSKATWRILLHSLEQPLPPNGRCTLFLPWGIHTPTHSKGKKTGQCSPPWALELFSFYRAPPKVWLQFGLNPSENVHSHLKRASTSCRKHTGFWNQTALELKHGFIILKLQNLGQLT